MNVYIVLANVIIFIHVLYILAVLAGLILVPIGGWCGWKWVRCFWLRMVHFGMIAIVLLETVVGWRCPLTDWEDQLRLKGGVEKRVLSVNPETGVETVRVDPAQDDFVGRCLNGILFPENMPTWFYPALYFSIGTLIFVSLFVVRPHRPTWPCRLAGDKAQAHLQGPVAQEGRSANENSSANDAS